MRFTTAASAAALVAAAYAQDTTITVGQGGLKFDPQFVDVTANSVITFVFAGGNHSVSQSSFASPCEPLDGGFSSGFVPVISAGAGSVGTWNLTVTDASKPIWFYCAQGPSAATNNEAHCEAGMVGGINIETSDKTGDAYVSNAKAGSTFVQPTTTALSAPLAFASATPIITVPASADTSASTGSQSSQSAGSSTDGAGSQTVTNTNTNTNTNTGPAGASNTNAATSASGGGNGTTTATGANTSTTNSGAGAIQASGFFAFLAAALGVAVL